MSQAEFAELMDVSVVHVWRLETGRRRPSARFVARMAAALGLDPMSEMQMSGVLEKQNSGDPQRPSRNAPPRPDSTAGGLSPFAIASTACSLPQTGGDAQEVQR